MNTPGEFKYPSKNLIQPPTKRIKLDLENSKMEYIKRVPSQEEFVHDIPNLTHFDHSDDSSICSDSDHILPDNQARQLSAGYQNFEDEDYNKGHYPLLSQPSSPEMQRKMDFQCDKDDNSILSNGREKLSFTVKKKCKSLNAKCDEKVRTIVLQTSTPTTRKNLGSNCKPTSSTPITPDVFHSSSGKISTLNDTFNEFTSDDSDSLLDDHFVSPISKVVTSVSQAKRNWKTSIAEYTNDDTYSLLEYDISRQPNRFPVRSANFSELSGSESDSMKSFTFNFKPKCGASYDLDEVENLNPELKYIDTHCHIDFLFKRKNFKHSYAEFQKQNDGFPSSYGGCIAIFCDPLTFELVDSWSRILSEDNVWAAFGCHPHNANKFNEKVEESLLKALNHKKVVALGEIGLDYSSRNSCERENQKKVFERQLQLAVEKSLPVVIHSRDSSEDTLSIMKKVLPKDYKIHRHCFTNDWDEAQIWLNEFTNLYIGITGLVTYPTAKEVHEVVKKIPLEKLLLETDTPYFLPRLVNRECKWSHPGMAIHVAAQVARLRSIPLEEVIKTTRHNTKQLFGV